MPDRTYRVMVLYVDSGGSVYLAEERVRAADARVAELLVKNEYESTFDQSILDITAEAA